VTSFSNNEVIQRLVVSDAVDPVGRRASDEATTRIGTTLGAAHVRYVSGWCFYDVVIWSSEMIYHVIVRSLHP
jgi:hypothetical protein